MNTQDETTNANPTPYRCEECRADTDGEFQTLTGMICRDCAKGPTQADMDAIQTEWIIEALREIGFTAGLAAEHAKDPEVRVSVLADLVRAGRI